MGLTVALCKMVYLTTEFTNEQLHAVFARYWQVRLFPYCFRRQCLLKITFTLCNMGITLLISAKISNKKSTAHKIVVEEVAGKGE